MPITLRVAVSHVVTPILLHMHACGLCTNCRNICIAEYAGASTHQTAKVDADVDFQCIAISISWTLTTLVPWDETKVRP
jgi:hypothetical protein